MAEDKFRATSQGLAEYAQQCLERLEGPTPYPDGQLRAMIDILARAVIENAQVLRCAFCDAKYPPGTPATQHEALTAHVKLCPKHPMREVERELATLREATRPPKLRTPAAARVEGYLAFYSGKSLDTNPYTTSGDELCQSWILGWIDGEYGQQ